MSCNGQHSIQELLKDMQHGKSEPGASKPHFEVKQGAEPFISGTFEYGLGRSAGGKKVYLFINKAQDQLKLHDAMVQFLGVYKINKRVRYHAVLRAIWNHRYSFKNSRKHCVRVQTHPQPCTLGSDLQLVYPACLWPCDCRDS